MFRLAGKRSGTCIFRLAGKRSSSIFRLAGKRSPGIFRLNVVCCVGRVEIQIEIQKGRCTANTDSVV